MDINSVLLGCIILFVVHSLSHWLLLLNDGVYWDGWVMSQWQRDRNWGEVQRTYSQLGMPILYYEHRFMASLPFPKLFYNLLAFISLYIASVSVYLIGTVSLNLPHYPVLLISALMLCFPGQQMAVEPVISMQYIFPQALFFLGCLCELNAQVLTGSNSLVLHAISTILFLLSFNMNSLLVLFYGFFVLDILMNIHNNGMVFSVSPSFFAQFFWLAILPVLYWSLKERFTPRWGIFSSYNQLKIFNLLDTRKFMSFVYSGIICQVTRSFQLLINRWGFLVFLTVAALALISERYQAIIPLGGITPLSWMIILLFGIFFLLCAITPYILVGQVAGLQGWETKNNLLLSLPASLIIISMINIVIKSEFCFWLVVVIIIACLVKSNHDYLILEAVWIKNRSFLENLKYLKNAEECSILGVLDQHPVQVSISGHPEHPPLVLSYMFESIWGKLFAFGIPVDGMRQERFSAQEVQTVWLSTESGTQLIHPDPAGMQGLIVIREGTISMPIPRLAKTYYLKKFFRPPSLDTFMKNVTTVTFVELGTK